MTPRHFQPRTAPRTTCTCRQTLNRAHQFHPVGDRCSCGNTVVEPALRPPSRCQVGEGDNSNRNSVRPCRCESCRLNSNSTPLSLRGRGRRGMLGLFGLRGALGQLGRVAGGPGFGGLTLNRRILFTPRNNVNSITQQTINENEADNNTIIT